MHTHYILIGVLSGLVAYNAYVMYSIRRDHAQEYDVLYSQLTTKYRNGAIILALIVAVVVGYGLYSWEGKRDM